MFKPKEETIKLDWYKKFGIEMLDSVANYEQFSTGDKIVNQTLAFIIKGKKADGKYYELTNLIDYLENLEKRLFMEMVGDVIYSEHKLPIKIEGQKVFEIPSELAFPLSKPPMLTFDKHLKPYIDRASTSDDHINRVIKGIKPDEKIVMSNRMTWRLSIKDRKTYSLYKLQRRLGFAVLPKNANRIKEY